MKLIRKAECGHATPSIHIELTEPQKIIKNHKNVTFDTYNRFVNNALFDVNKQMKPNNEKNVLIRILNDSMIELSCK